MQFNFKRKIDGLTDVENPVVSGLSMLPVIDDTTDIGSTTKRFRNGNFSENIIASNLDLTSTTNQIVFGNNQTLTFSVATPVSNHSITFDDPLGNDNVVYKSATQTLTNKTLTSPTLMNPALFNGAAHVLLPSISSTVSTLAANTYTGPQTISDTTASTSSTTGALVVNGGVGIGGDVHLGGNFYLSGSTTPLKNYDEEDFITNWNFGSTVVSNYTVKITRVGRDVTITMPTDLTGIVSGSTGDISSASSLPSIYWPAAKQTKTVWVANNGGATSFVGGLYVRTDGVIGWNAPAFALWGTGSTTSLFSTSINYTI